MYESGLSALASVTYLCLWSGSEIVFRQGELCNIYLWISDKNEKEDVYNWNTVANTFLNPHADNLTAILLEV